MTHIPHDQQYVLDNVSFSYIKPSEIHGRGLFASQDLPEGMILGMLDGQVIPWDRYDELRAYVKEHEPDPVIQFLFFEWNCLSETTLLVRPFRTKYSFINHSRTPNLTLVREPLRIVTLRPVKKDEEFLLDYREEPLRREYLEGHGSTYL